MTDQHLVGLLDGRLVPPTMPLLRPDDAGVTRGDGVFETTLAVDGRPRDLPEHLARMAESARQLDLDLPAPEHWHRGIDAVLGGWTGAEMVLRLIATRGPEGAGTTAYVTAGPVAAAARAQRTAGVRVLLLDRGFAGPDAATAPWLLAGAKTLSYAVNMAALRHAARHDAEDVIFVGSDGAVLESPTAAVVIARHHADGARTLLTPPLEGVLDSITVRRLFAAARTAGWHTGYQRFTPADLTTADGIWLASSVRLLTPVLALDGIARGDGELTAELAALLQIPA